jgi:hypothetical protein
VTHVVFEKLTQSEHILNVSTLIKYNSSVVQDGSTFVRNVSAKMSPDIFAESAFLASVFLRSTSAITLGMSRRGRRRQSPSRLCTLKSISSRSGSPKWSLLSMVCSGRCTTGVQSHRCIWLVWVLGLWVCTFIGCWWRCDCFGKGAFGPGPLTSGVEVHADRHEGP